MQEGEHVLIIIPREVVAEHALFRVVAAASRMGGMCGEIYFQKINVTGSWALATKRGGYAYFADRDVDQTPEWVAFGMIKLKVVHGRTQYGTMYLNLYVKHLGQAGFRVGGLLGEDDHSDEATPPTACFERTALKSQSVTMGTHAQRAAMSSSGIATLA